MPEARAEDLMDPIPIPVKALIPARGVYFHFVPNDVQKNRVQ